MICILDLNPSLITILVTSRPLYFYCCLSFFLSLSQHLYLLLFLHSINSLKYIQLTWGFGTWGSGDWSKGAAKRRQERRGKRILDWPLRIVIILTDGTVGVNRTTRERTASPATGGHLLQAAKAGPPQDCQGREACEAAFQAPTHRTRYAARSHAAAGTEPADLEATKFLENRSQIAAPRFVNLLCLQALREERLQVR